MSAFTFFDTVLGSCGIIWGEGGITGVLLPEASVVATRARLLARHPGARPAPPPPDVQDAIDAITRLLAGTSSELSGIALDMTSLSAFDRRVYEVTRTIPPGATLSYGEIATRLGERDAARAVGQALGANPFAIVVPCHRVVAAGGKVGGFSAHGGAGVKLRLLAIEGAHPRVGLFRGDEQ